MRLPPARRPPPEPHLSILRRWLGRLQLVFSILIEAISSPSVRFWGGFAWRGGFGQYPETDLSKMWVWLCWCIGFRGYGDSWGAGLCASYPSRGSVAACALSLCFSCACRFRRCLAWSSKPSISNYNDKGINNANNSDTIVDSDIAL